MEATAPPMKDFGEHCTVDACQLGDEIGDCQLGDDVGACQPGEEAAGASQLGSQAAKG